MLARIESALVAMPKWALGITALLLMALVVILDYYTGAELSFSIFYIPPIMMVAWYSGMASGAVVSAIGALCWLGADIASGHVYSSRFIPIWNMTVRLGFFLMVAALLSKLRMQVQHLRSLAETDQLTGLTNSRRFYELLSSERSRAARYSHQFTLAYIDLDNFKAVNDSLGHDEGDRLLVVFSNTLMESVRSTDTVARLGGDEFAALFPETGFVQSATLLDKLRGRLTGRMADGNWPVTVSMGAVTFDQPGDVQDMIKAADNLMYKVKKSGKNNLLHEMQAPGL